MSPATLAAAFGAGALSFATPCVLPLVPAYLAAVGGASVDDLRARRGVARTLRGVAPFVLGFGTVFVLFGALVGAAGSALDDWRDEVAKASGILVVAMGLIIAGALPLPALPGLTAGERRPHSAMLLGGAFALSWTPCVGPVLAAVLALASTRGGAAQAALLLGAFAAGLAVSADRVCDRLRQGDRRGLVPA